MLRGTASQVQQYVNRTNYAHIKCAILSVLESTENCDIYNLYTCFPGVCISYCLCSLMSSYLQYEYLLHLT